ncbi:MAG TPA: hypothetical protein VF699_04500 [Caulobacteraceae bacterium]|jgi:hypothetical protein
MNKRDGWLERGSSGSTADYAGGGPDPGVRSTEGATARPATRLRDGETPDQLAEQAARAESRQEALMDEAVEETFPASDPISPMVCR